jgi:cardiolipin synthase A/B
VEVKILLDGIGGAKAEKEYIEKLEEAGGDVAYFRKISWWNLTRVGRRNHIRDFVVDGKYSYLGGLAISDTWLGNADTSKSWHDFMFKVDGAMAKRGEKIFSTLWGQTTGEILPVKNTELKNNDTTLVSLLSTPSPDLSTNMEHFIWFSLNSAEESIYIENPYILPSKEVLEVLKQKAQNGVKVEIIVPGEKTDAKYVRWASKSLYNDLLKAGVKIYEYEPARLHAKIITIDGRWSVIGSANLDNRSSEINLELIYGIYDEKLATTLEEKFEEDRKVSHERYPDKKVAKLWLGPVEFVSRLFVKQY